MIAVVLLSVMGWAAGERTVVVTPRPRWLVQELRADPSTPAIPPILPARVPVISLRVFPANPNPAISAALPMEHRGKAPGLVIPFHLLRKPTQVVTSLRPIVVLQPSVEATASPPPAAYTHTSFALANRPHQSPSILRQNVFVESVPSLSINLGEDSAKDVTDYLIPPRYPSVYETREETLNPLPTLPKKKNKNNKKKLNLVTSVEETSNEIADSTTPDSQEQNTGERIEFQLHGHTGPESYKFGFDTGAGKNRQFRYEEKDAVGNVKGRFGYYDNTGKLQVFNYRADENGYHAEQVD